MCFQLLLADVSKDSTGTQAQQSDGNRKKREVIKQDDRKEPGQRQFQQERRKTAEGNGGCENPGALRLHRRGYLGNGYVGDRHEERKFIRMMADLFA